MPKALGQNLKFCQYFKYCHSFGKANSERFWTMGIWKSWNRHLGISIVTGSGIGIGIEKNIFCLQKFFWKNRICFFLGLFMASLPLCYKYLFLYDFLFIHPKVSIGVLEKGYLNFRKYPFICVLKKLSKISAYFQAKNQRWSPF